MMEFVSIVVLLALVGYFVQKNIKLGKRILYLESQIDDIKNPKRSVSSTFMTHNPHRGSRPSNRYEKVRKLNLEGLMSSGNVVDPYSDRFGYSHDVNSMQKAIDNANISDSYRGSGGSFSGSGSGSSWSDSGSSSISSSSSSYSSDSSSSSSSSGD